MIHYIIEQIEDKYDTYLSEDEIQLVYETLSIIEEKFFGLSKITGSVFGKASKATPKKILSPKQIATGYGVGSKKHMTAYEKLADDLEEAIAKGRSSRANKFYSKASNKNIETVAQYRDNVFNRTGFAF